MKYLFIVLIIVFIQKAYAQDTTYKHEVGLTIFTLCEDHNSSASPHLLPGVQYKYHTEKYNLKSSLVYLGYRVEADPGYYAARYVKEFIFSAGIERYFFNGNFQLVQGADLVLRDHITESKGEIETDILFGAAATGGFIFHINNRMSIFAELDVEFLFDESGYGGVLVTPVRMFSINYNF